MARPITLQTVAAPNFAASNALLSQASQTTNDGLNNMLNALDPSRNLDREREAARFQMAQDEHDDALLTSALNRELAVNRDKRDADAFVRDSQSRAETQTLNALDKRLKTVQVQEAETALDDSLMVRESTQKVNGLSKSIIDNIWNHSAGTPVSQMLPEGVKWNDLKPDEKTSLEEKVNNFRNSRISLGESTVGYLDSAMSAFTANVSDGMEDATRTLGNLFEAAGLGRPINYNTGNYGENVTIQDINKMYTENGDIDLTVLNSTVKALEPLVGGTPPPEMYASFLATMADNGLLYNDFNESKVKREFKKFEKRYTTKGGKALMNLQQRLSRMETQATDALVDARTAAESSLLQANASSYKESGRRAAHSRESVRELYKTNAPRDTDFSAQIRTMARQDPVLSKLLDATNKKAESTPIDPLGSTAGATGGFRSGSGSTPYAWEAGRFRP